MQKIIFSNSFKNVVTKNNDKVSAIISKAIEYSQVNANIHNIIFKDAEINYLTIRNNGNVSYLPKGKEQQYNDNGEWKRDGRQEGKPSKIIRKLFNKKLLNILKDIDFQEFANNYKARTSTDGMTFKIITGEDIADCYSNAEREDGEAGLNNSCMNDNDIEYFEIYANCSRCAMLILTNIIDGEEKLSGRALLWTLSDGRKILDRIYCAKEHYYDLFLNYCSENNIIRKKSYKTYHDRKIFILPDGTEQNITIRISTDTECNYYPYIDTLSYGGDGYITNEESDAYYCYNSTNGDREEFQRTYDEIGHEYIDDDCAVQIDNGSRYYFGLYTHENNVVTLANGGYCYRYDDMLISVNGEYYLSDDDNICYCDETDEYLFTEDCTFCDKGTFEGVWILTENARSVCGTIYHIDDIKEC